jgi:hypothetical protein
MSIFGISSDFLPAHLPILVPLVGVHRVSQHIPAEAQVTILL